MAWVCLSKVYVLKFHPQCEVLRMWKLSSSMVFRVGVFGRWFGLDKVRRLEPPWLNPVGIIRRESPQYTHIHTHIHIFTHIHTHTTCLYPCDALCHLKTLSARRPSLDVALSIGPPQTWAKYTSFLYYLSSLWYCIISNRKWTNSWTYLKLPWIKKKKIVI